MRVLSHLELLSAIEFDHSDLIFFGKQALILFDILSSEGYCTQLNFGKPNGNLFLRQVLHELSMQNMDSVLQIIEIL